jgi:hypothetical protein
VFGLSANNRQTSKESEKMSCRPNRFHGLFYEGDWHKRLVDAIQLAKAETRSNDLLSAMEALEHQLTKTDECVHTVTAIQAVPPSMDVQFLMLHVKRCIDVEPATLQLIPTGEIELTITARGSLRHVQTMATAILSSGLHLAESEIWAEAALRAGRRGQHIGPNSGGTSGRH